MSSECNHPYNLTNNYECVCFGCNRHLSDIVEELGEDVAIRTEAIAHLHEELDSYAVTINRNKAELAALREAVNVYLNLEDCMSLEALEALLPEEVQDEQEK